MRLNLQAAGYAFDVRVTLSSVPYVLRFRWNWRAGDWRVTAIEEASGDALFSNRRLSPGAPLPLPDGMLVAVGKDPYRPQDLGVTLNVYYASDEDLFERALVARGDPAFVLV